jgi:hypothetical protein
MTQPVPGVNLRFEYDVPLGDFLYRGELVLPTQGYGLDYEAVELRITRAAVEAQRVQWDFPGGQMQIRTPIGPERRAEGATATALRAVIAPAEQEALAGALPALEAALDASALWAADAWPARALRSGMGRRAGHDTDLVVWSEADHLDLWPSPVRSRGEDGAPPTVVLRLTRDLGRASDALLWPYDGRTVRVVAGTPAGDASIRAGCGRVFAEVAAWFAKDRAGRFPTDTP